MGVSASKVGGNREGLPYLDRYGCSLAQGSQGSRGMEPFICNYMLFVCFLFVCFGNAGLTQGVAHEEPHPTSLCFKGPAAKGGEGWQMAKTGQDRSGYKPSKDCRDVFWD